MHCCPPFGRKPVVQKVAPLLLASDASSTFGLGAVQASVSQSVARSVMSHRLSQWERVTVGAPHHSPKARTLLSHPVHLEIPASDFKIIVRTRLSDGDHINVREVRTIYAVVKWLARTTRWSGCVAAVLVDSTFALDPACKGRSGNKQKNHLLHKMLTISIASQASVRVDFTPTEWNLADFQSRGAPLPLTSLERWERRIRRFEAALRRSANISLALVP